jgi:alpha-galactosidase
MVHQDDWLHVMYNADNSINIAKYGGPGGWNDLDMLEIGNGNTAALARV